MLEDGEAHLVLALAPDVVLEPGNRLEVVVEDLGPGGEDDVDQLASSVEIGREHFDGGAGPPPHGQDALAEVVGAAVGQVVTRHRGDHDVAQPQPVAGFGQSFGLVERNLVGPPALDRAKAARPGANVAQDHERRRSPGPALRAVRAAGALADGLEPQLADQAARKRHPARGGNRPLEPLGQAALLRARDRRDYRIHVPRRRECPVEHR